MLELYRKRFNEIMSDTKGKKRTVLLSSLMTEIESYYKISMLKERFESETDPAVKGLYLTIANARRF